MTGLIIYTILGITILTLEEDNNLTLIVFFVGSIFFIIYNLILTL